MQWRDHPVHGRPDPRVGQRGHPDRGQLRHPRNGMGAARCDVRRVARRAKQHADDRQPVELRDLSRGVEPRLDGWKHRQRDVGHQYGECQRRASWRVDHQHRLWRPERGGNRKARQQHAVEESEWRDPGCRRKRYRLRVVSHAQGIGDRARHHDHRIRQRRGHPAHCRARAAGRHRRNRGSDVQRAVLQRARRRGRGGRAIPLEPGAWRQDRRDLSRELHRRDRAL